MKLENDAIAVGPGCTVELRGNDLHYVAATDKTNIFRKVVKLPPGVSGGDIVKLGVALGLITVRTRTHLHVYSFNVKTWIAQTTLSDEVRR